MSNYPQRQQQVQKVDPIHYLAGLEPDFNAALTEQRMKWAKEFEYAKQAIEKNQTLRKAAEGNLDSLRAAIINVAAVAISLNPVLKQAFLVPRGGQVCLDISYQGLIDLAVEAGSILWAEAHLYCEGDVYKNRGVHEPPLHEFDAFGDRGDDKIRGAYCVAKRHDGTYHVHEMTLADINKIKAASKAQDAGSPWVKWFSQMCLKAVIKRASKAWVKVGSRFASAVQILNDQEGNAEPIEHDDRPTQSETLNDLLADDRSPMVDGMSIENWILAAESKDDFAKARDMIREMPPGAEQDRLKKLWITLLSEAAHSHQGSESESELH